MPALPLTPQHRSVPPVPSATQLPTPQPAINSHTTTSVQPALPSYIVHFLSFPYLPTPFLSSLVSSWPSLLPSPYPATRQLSAEQISNVTGVE